MDCTHFVTFLLCSKAFGLAAPIHLLQDYACQLRASNENRRHFERSNSAISTVKRPASERADVIAMAERDSG
jgi:hypothetical protein